MKTIGGGGSREDHPPCGRDRPGGESSIVGDCAGVQGGRSIVGEYTGSQGGRSMMGECTGSQGRKEGKETRKSLQRKRLTKTV